MDRKTLALAWSSLASSRWLKLALATMLYLFMALIATYPAPQFWSTQVIGGSWDSGQNLWNFWWTEKSLQNGDSFPYYTTMLYHPSGVSLAYHPLALFNGYQVALLRYVFGISLPAAYNTIVIGAFLVSALSAYWLVKSLTGSSLSGFVAGVIFAFSPYHLSRLHFGHLEIFSSVQFIPLVCLCTIKVCQTRQWRYTIASAFLMAAIGWQSLQMALGTGMMSILLFVLFGYSKKKTLQILGHLAIMIFLTCLLMLPVVYPLLRDMDDFQDQVDMTAGSIRNSPDLLNFFLPDRSISTFWRFVLGKISSQPLTNFFRIKGQRTAFLGLGVMVLAGLSAVLVPAKTWWRWGAIATIFFVVCLGPVLYINGKPIFSAMPYTLLSHLPIIGLGREPARWTVFIVLALAVMVGYLGTRTKCKSLWCQGLVLLGALSIYAEFVAVPVRLDDRLAKIPPYYQKIAQTSQTIGGILDVPLDLYGADGPACQYMVYQIVHQKPIVGGYIARTPRYAAESLASYPFTNQLRARLYDDNEPYYFSEQLIVQGPEEFQILNIDYVILHKYWLLDADVQIVYNALIQAIGLPDYQDEQIAAWHLDK